MADRPEDLLHTCARHHGQEESATGARISICYCDSLPYLENALLSRRGTRQASRPLKNTLTSTNLSAWIPSSS